MKESTKLKLDAILYQIQSQLDLSKETERDLLEEIAAHLEDAVYEAKAQGVSEDDAMVKVAAQFGVDDVGQALQDVHAPWESADAILACLIPVAAALVLRWLIFAPSGAILEWTQLLLRPAFWVVACAALLIPVIQFRRWPYALISWAFFWVMTVIFTTLPNASQW